MKLRLRLALTVVAVSVPMVASVGYVQHSLRQRNQAEVLEASTLARIQAGERERCEAQPATWGARRGPRPPAFQGNSEGPPRTADGRPAAPSEAEPPWREEGPRGGGPLAPARPPRMDRPGPNGPWPMGVAHFAYGAGLESLNPDAPVLSESVRREAQEGRATVVRRTARDGESVLDVLIRMPWEEGPCAFILARRIEPRGPPLGGIPPPEVLGVPLLAVLVMALALGPVVRRVRQLTAEVRASANSRYVEPVLVRGHDEVAELARAFQEARAEIQSQLSQQEAREQALRDFLANTTHDVMTPLTVLQGHLSGLQQRLSRGEPLESSVVGDAMGEAHYIASLVHNLAAATRLEAGRPQVQWAEVDLNAVVSRVLGRHQPIARQQRISLESGVPETAVWVHGDVTLIEQAVSNTSPTMSRRCMAGPCRWRHRSTAAWRSCWRARPPTSGPSCAPSSPSGPHRSLTPRARASGRSSPRPPLGCAWPSPGCARGR